MGAAAPGPIATTGTQPAADKETTATQGCRFDFNK